MVFSSPLFLFLFLPLTLLAYFVAPWRFRNVVLLSASLFFYAWGEVFYAGVMLLSIACNYLLGIAVERGHDRGSARRWLAFAVGVNLLLLLWFKYANFFADNLNPLIGAIGVAPIKLDPVHLPLGISFFTFHCISYLVDVYRRNAVAQRHPADFALYIALFPQLVAGPIIRYKDIASQLRTRFVTANDFAYGATRFTIGLAKKVLLANAFGAVADPIFALPRAELTPTLAWCGIVAYTLQIYFDFSGYSDMAVGLCRMFGFRILENFNYPYISRSVQEFWRRWHISLSTWFRDYVYVPLGGNRCSPLRQWGNLVTVFLLCGLWHGASWNFVVWGAWHGLFLGLERTPVGAWLARLPGVFRHAYLLAVVMAGWVFFRAETLSDALAYFGVLFGGQSGNALLHPPGRYIDPLAWTAFGVGLIAMTPLLPRGWARWAEPRAPGPRTLLLGGAQVLGLLLLFAASASLLAAGTYNSFIYFRF